MRANIAASMSFALLTKSRALHFLALKAQLVVQVSALVMVSTIGQFLGCCSSTHGAPVPSHLQKLGHEFPRAP